jgi:hypothetical protein
VLKKAEREDMGGIVWTMWMEQSSCVIFNREMVISLSCPWRLPSLEDIDTGKYRIERDRDIEKVIRPQDVVMERVTKFADAKGLPFWIDKLCIDQLDGSGKIRY